MFLNDDISRINSMKTRNIDYTRGVDHARQQLEKSDLSSSTIKGCLTLSRKYADYINSK